MLKQLCVRLAVMGVVSAGLVVPLTAPAVAEPPPSPAPPYCPPTTDADCIIDANKPGGPGGGGGGSDGGLPNPCPWRLLDPPPPAGDPLWEGHQPGDGAVYVRVCETVGLGGAVDRQVDYMWSATAPATVSVADLAAEAIGRLPIRGPDIGIAPDPNGAGAVGLPVWLWTAVTPRTWGPGSATASVPGLSVTAIAHAEKIVWNMGDGRSVTCTTPGTPYMPSYGNRESPDCGHRYGTSSRSVSGGRYTVTGITTWRVDWAASTGQTGSLTVTRRSSTSVRIDEIQVVTQ